MSKNKKEANKSREEKLNELNDFQKSILGYIRIERDKLHRRDFYYLEELNKIHEARENKKFAFSFNWAAAINGLFWCWYRKMYLASIFMSILCSVPAIFTHCIVTNPPLFCEFILIVINIFIGGIVGNYFYYYFIKRKLEKGRSAVNNTFAMITLLVLIFLCGISAVILENARHNAHSNIHETNTR